MTTTKDIAIDNLLKFVGSDDDKFLVVFEVLSNDSEIELQDIIRHVRPNYRDIAPVAIPEIQAKENYQTDKAYQLDNERVFDIDRNKVYRPLYKHMAEDNKRKFTSVIQNMIHNNLASDNLIAIDKYVGKIVRYLGPAKNSRHNIGICYGIYDSVEYDKETNKVIKKDNIRLKMFVPYTGRITQWSEKVGVQVEEIDLYKFIDDIFK